MDATRPRAAIVLGLVGVLTAAGVAAMSTGTPSSLATAAPSPLAVAPSRYVATMSRAPSPSPSASAPASRPALTSLVAGDAGPSVRPTIPFDSAVYDYGVRYPSEWSLEPSSGAPIPDLIEGTEYQWYGIGQTVDSRTSITAFVRSHPLDRLVNGECAIGGDASVTFRPAPGSIRWLRAEIDGRTALRRSMCGYVDAVVIAAGTLYRFTLRHRSIEGDMKLFDKIAATIELPTVFRSRTHGYRLTMLPAWTAAPSSIARSDVFHAPRPSMTRLSISRRHKGSQPLDLFAEEALPHRVTGAGCHWNTSGIIFIPATPRLFERTTIAGREALVREECGFVDAAVGLGDDALIIVLRSGRRMPDGDRYNFDRLVESLRIETGT